MLVSDTKFPYHLASCNIRNVTYMYSVDGNYHSQDVTT